jgi:zinc/manganese transport system substrate-binding protein
MRFIPIALVAALALAGCATAPQKDDGLVHIVASTNVYGDIAHTIGGSDVSVTSIINDPSQDPHSFEASAQVQLALSKADVVIENGGGYDDWADTLLSGAGNADATVLNATKVSGYQTGGQFNEHLWYDFPTVQKVVEQLVTTLSAEAPASAATFRSNADTFEAGLSALEAAETGLAAASNGAGVAITEPVPLYLLTASGFTNVTPAAFSEAIEEGTDVSPAVLAETLAIFTNHTARLLVYNAQTTGPETEQVLAAAKAAGVPVVPVTETMPHNSTYLKWMTANLQAIAAALA